MNKTIDNFNNDIKSLLHEALKKKHVIGPTILIDNVNNLGLIGDIIFVKVNGTSESGANIEYDLVVKIEKCGEVRGQYPAEEVFKREIYVYEEILPTFLQLQIQKNIKEKFESLPKFFGSLLSKNTRSIVLENVKRLGYETLEIGKMMNINQAKLILVEVGKFHAFSLALKDQQEKKFRAITDNLKSILSLQLKEKLHIVKTTRKNLIESYEAFKGDEAILKKLRLIENDLPNFLTLPDDLDDYSVVCHLDLQPMNLFFKYKDEEKENPTNVIFIDWQLAKLASPICDLVYAIYLCSSNDIFEHFSELQQIYYNSLSSFLKQLGSDVNKLYPYEVYMQHWKKYSKFGLAMLFLTVKVVSVAPDEIPALFSRQTDKIGDFFDFDTKNVDVWQNRVREMVKHFIKQGFL